MRRSRIAVALPALLLAGLFAACAKENSNDVAPLSDLSQSTKISVVTGDNQTARIGTALPAALVVKVSDGSSAGIGGVTVNWTVTSGGGSVSSATSVTDASGLAQINWTLGAATGAQTISASITGTTQSSVTFGATGTAPTAAAVALSSGNSQSATVGTGLSAALVVKVTDASGVGVAGAAVNWAVASGGGSVAAAASITDASGLAQMTWTLGSAVGAQTVTATVTGLESSPVTFSATATAAAPPTIALSSGNNQTAIANTALAAPLVVKITDASNAPVAGMTVNWAVASGGGAVSATTSVTDASGLAQISWSLGGTVGTQTATATVAGLTGSPVTFSATGTASPATAIVLNSGNNQTATANTSLAAPLVVKVTDASSAPVAGVTVNWTVTAGGGSVSAATSVTNASGLAQISWSLGGTVGTQTATATVAGLTGSPVTFSATGTASPATAIALNSGNNQTATVSTPLGAPLVVKVTDASSAPVAGVTVNWAVTLGGGSVSAATSVTNASGLAQINWTLGSTVGAQTARATVAGLTGSPVTFTATGTAAPATNVALSSGNNQTATVGNALAAPLVVKVTNASNGGVAGVTVNWSVSVGGGAVSAATSVTDASGLAQITWTLGSTVGTQTAKATVTGLTGSPVTFNATGTAAPATAVAISSGNNQTATVGTMLTAPLVVKVTNASNGAVGGVTVNWAVATGGGSVSAGTSVTNSSGLAQITWTLGNTVGAQTAKATVTGLTGSPVTFSATGVAVPVATTMAVSSGNNQSATVGSALGAPLVVKVTDASSVAVAGVTVNWAAATGGGSVSGGTSITNSSGLAQINWTLGSTVGAQTATATVSGLTGSPVTFSATGVAAGARVQRYLSPSGSDANTGQDAAHPWKTFAKAFGSSGIGAGGELILLDGTYSDATGTGYISYLGTNSAQAPSGKGRTAALQTYVHALNPGNVIVGAASGDALFVGRSTRKDSCITFEGIQFEGSASLYNTLWITVRNSGVHDEAQNGGSVVAMGTNDGSWGNSYNLIEDTWIWGKNRALAISYRSDHNVWRRVVLRGDGCNSTACTGSGNPNIGITTYESTFTEFQNVFVVDRILGGGSGYADFATAQHTPGQSHGGNRWRGSASLQSEDSGIDFEWDNANTFPVVDVADMVIWSNTTGAKAGINISGLGGSEDARIANMTIYESQGSDLVRLAPGTSGSVKNMAVYGTGRYGINSSVTPTFTDLFGTFSGSDYNQTNCSTGCKTTNPTSDGATPSLQYPFRIESGSVLSGTGSGGANYGATIVNQFGATGTHWGEAGYNALTSTSLWPWPTQTTMKTQMCSGVTRGFCSGSQTFTDYVWSLLGHAAPSSF